MPWYYEKWDGRGIGKLPDEKAVREHCKMPDWGVAYLVFKEGAGRHTYFQYHKPWSGDFDWMTEEDWEQYAQKHVDWLNDQEKKTELAQKTQTDKVEIWVERRFAQALQDMHDDLRQQHPVEIEPHEEKHAKDLGIVYKIKDTSGGLETK